MATKFRVKRSNVSGVTPTTGDIDTAELAINIPDRKLFTSNGTAVYELGSNLTNLSVSANLTIGSAGDIVLTPGAGIFANGATGIAGQVLTSNGTSAYWAAANAGISAVVSQQFTANGTANSFTVTGGYIPSAIEVYVAGVKQVPGTDVTITSGSTVNFAVPPLNGQIVDVFGYQSVGGIGSFLALTGGTLSGNLTFTNGSVIVANGSFGTNGQVLTSNGTSMYWSSAGFTNGQSISVNNFAITGAFTANGANGTAGQVLTTSGAGVYWSSAGVNTAAQYAWTNTHSFAANLTILGTSELIIANGAGIEANGGFGTAGQVLTSSSTGVYWSSAGVNTAAQYVWTNTHTFNANVTVNAASLFITSAPVTAGFPSVILQGNTNTERVAIRSADGPGGPGSATAVFLASTARGTISSPTAVQNTDALGYYQFGGYDGTSYSRSVWIAGFAAENYSSTNRGGYMVFSTTPVGSTTIAERMRITADGDVFIGANSAQGAAALQVSGTGTRASIGFVKTDITSSGGSITGIDSRGYDGNTYVAGGTINFRAAENWSNTNHGTDIQFRTTPTGSGGSLTESMRITANGNLGIGTASPAVRLSVSSTDAIQMPVGNTASRPAASNGMIRYNTNTGLVEVVANTTWTGVMAAYSSVREQFTASNNQTTFTVTGGYVPGQIDVYYNGVKLRSGSEVNVSSGSSVILAAGAANNALIEVVGIGPTFVVSNTAQLVYQQFTASNNQTTFTVTNGYVPGQVDVFADGVKLVNGVDVNVSSGGNIVLSTGVPNNTIVEVKGYTTPLVSAQTSTAVRQTFTANATVNNNFTVTGGYIPGQVDVFYNGAKLVNGSDVNTSSGTTIVLTSNAASGATVDVVGINYFTAGGGVTTPVRQQFVSTANQVTFTITGGYTPGQIDVYRNGVRMTPGVDVNISGGSTVVLASPAANGDNIDVVGFAATSYQDSVRKSGDTISGSLGISANLTVTGAATFSNTIAVTGTSTLTGNVTTSGVFTDPTGTIRPLVLGTAQTASGTFVDFTGIPSWVRRITIMFNGVSTNGNAAFLVQLGAGSIATSGYQSMGTILQNASTPSAANSTTGFVSSNAGAAAEAFHGSYVYNLLGGNFWTGGGSLVRYSGTYQTHLSTGGVTLSGTLDRVRITTTNGTDAFDAGTINILYE